MHRGFAAVANNRVASASLFRRLLPSLLPSAVPSAGLVLLGACMAASIAADGVSLVFWEPSLPLYKPLPALHV